MPINLAVSLSPCVPQGKVLKHEAFEAEVTAHKGRVFGVIEMGQGEGPQVLQTHLALSTASLPTTLSLLLPLSSSPHLRLDGKPSVCW